MACYEPIASIPQPSQDFNYTLIRTSYNIIGNRYSDYYENPKVIKKTPEKHDSIKLDTIL